MSRRRRSYRYYSEWGPYYPPSQPRQVKDGIKAKSQKGKIGSTWWADKWIGALEAFGWENRLARGRSYARKGQVIRYDIQPGVVTAKVQGTQPRPYSVTIKLQPLDDAAWDRVTDAMVAQAVFAAQLLAGEMPPDIEEAFRAARVPLFPQASKDLQTDCSCPDWANPCKHIAAVYYILAEAFDEDPFLIFRLRGRSREQIMDTLRRKRAEAGGEAGEERAEEKEEEEETTPSLEDSLDTFWQMGPGLEDFRVTIAPPPVPLALLKRLGSPPFWEEKESLEEALAPAYAAITARALETAFGGTPEAPVEEAAPPSAPKRRSRKGN